MSSGTVRSVATVSGRRPLLLACLHRYGDECNRQGDALNALRRARQTFADELGIDPGPALRGLEADILAQAPALSASVPTPPTLSPAPAAVSATTPATPDDDGTDLIDRTRELARITQAIADLHGGRSTRAGTQRDPASDRSCFGLRSRGRRRLRAGTGAGPCVWRARPCATTGSGILVHRRGKPDVRRRRPR